MSEKPLALGTSVALGTVVKPYGKISAIGLLQGERYYWLIDTRGTVSMMPADVIEPRSPPKAKG